MIIETSISLQQLGTVLANTCKGQGCGVGRVEGFKGSQALKIILTESGVGVKVEKVCSTRLPLPIISCK